MSPRHLSLVLVATQLAACGPPSTPVRSASATRAAQASATSDARTAEPSARRAPGRDAEQSRAALLRALARYERSALELTQELRTLAVGIELSGKLNHRYLRSALERAEADLGRVDADLALAARDPELFLDLCLACWEKDWNGDGRVDRQDRLLLQIEKDASGQPIPENDPRRRPTFRFDHGDVHWARAFVAFQRALMDVALGYELGDVDALLAARRERARTLRVRLVRPERLKQAREQVLLGLRHSEAARRAYLAERDDEREWVPNPRQKSHPLPLPVDAALYATWEGVLRDVERLMTSQEGLSIAELARLGDPSWKDPPQGFLDVGSLFSAPRDLVFDMRALERLETARDRRSAEAALRSVLGPHYVPRMKPSPLLGRLRRMKAEVERGEESLELKLRYLLWIN